MARLGRRKRQAAGQPDHPAPVTTTPAPAPAAPGEPPLPRRLGLVCAVATGLLVVGFLILKCFALHAHRSDEGIYFYDAVRVAEGARLYRDLFFAHPPLHVVLPALIVRLFGYSFYVLKAIPQLAGAAQGVLVFLVARRLSRNAIAGVASAFVLLFAEDFLKATSYATDINLACAFLFAGLLLALYRRPLLGGVLAGASVMTLLQTTPVALALGACVWAHDRPHGKRFAIGFVAFVAAVHLFFALYAGGAFFDQVYRYHLDKVPAEGSGWHQLGFTLADNLAVWAGGLAGLVVLWFEPGQRRLALAILAVVVAQVAAVVTRPVVFPFYYQPAFLPLALALGLAVAAGVERVRLGASRRARVLGAALVAAVTVLPTLAADPLTALVSPTRAEQLRTYRQRYTWRDAPVIGGPLNGLVRTLFFEGGVRAAGGWHLAITEYLWNQSRGFDSFDAIVEAVRRAPPGQMFGDSTSAPLVALAAGRRLALDAADTNQQRFSSGTTGAERMIADLEAAGGPAVVLNAGNGGLFALPEFQRWLAENYVADQSFADAHGSRYTLYRRR